jgi:polysaccharide deacetylase family protein (PEP-CTERM system associated)
MRPQNIITVDWEDWFHICEVDHILPQHEWDTYPSILPEATSRLLDFFAAHGITATFFILGYSARRFPHLVRSIAKAGHEIAFHGHDHRLVYGQKPEDFRQDMIQGKEELEGLCKTSVLGFRAPQWSLNERCPWGLEILADAGYIYDASHAPLPIIGYPSYPQGVHTLQTSKGQLYEFPPMTLNILGLQVPAGGGWGLKTWPMPAIRNKMHKLNRAGTPATFFIHPADVVQHQSPVPLPFIKRVVTQFGFRTTLTSLDNILTETDLISIRTYMEHCK